MPGTSNHQPHGEERCQKRMYSTIFHKMKRKDCPLSDQHCKLVSWYSEPSQPQQITSGLKQTSICLLFTLHAGHQTTNSPKTTKSVLKQTYTKQNIHKHQTQNFWRINPISIAPVKKAHKDRTRWYHGPFCWFINAKFSKSIKKEWPEIKQKTKKQANTSKGTFFIMKEIKKSLSSFSR